jgi:sialate O-acetylesterase
MGTKEEVFMPRPPDLAATVEAEGVGWQVCSPVTARHYTGVGYFFCRELHKELDVPIGLINASWGGSRIEPWIPPAGLKSVQDLKEISDNLEKQLGGTIDYKTPTVIYNGMIHPLLPYAIRGAIWYQGESNGNEGESYFHKMRALINGWRGVWNQGDFPFYFVQLPNFLAPGNDPKGGDGFARIREAQSKVAATVKNTGMAVTIDVGEANDIHPSNKYSVGKRLALWALAKDYGRKDLVHSGPVYRSMKAAGKTIELSFDHVGGGLMAARATPYRSREAAQPLDGLDGLAVAGAGTEMPEPTDKLDGFAIAGEDRTWHWADAAIKGDKVMVSSGEVEQPVAVRYAFSANPVRANLYNREGIPASPFRTDNW